METAPLEGRRSRRTLIAPVSSLPAILGCRAKGSQKGSGGEIAKTLPSARVTGATGATRGMLRPDQ